MITNLILWDTKKNNNELKTQFRLKKSMDKNLLPALGQ